MQAGLGESVISISLFNSIFQSTPSQRHGVCDIHRTSGAGTAGGTGCWGWHAWRHRCSRVSLWGFFFINLAGG